MIEQAIMKIVDKKDLTYNEAYEVISEIIIDNFFPVRIIFVGMDCIGKKAPHVWIIRRMPFVSYEIGPYRFIT